MRIILLILIFFVPGLSKSQELTIDSDPVAKFIYLNVPGHSGRSLEEKQLRKELHASLMAEDMPALASYLRNNYKINSSGTIFIFCSLIKRFDSSKEKYNRDECIELVIDILDHYSHKPDIFALYLASASEILDSRLLSYVNSQEASKSEYCKSIVKEMNDHWQEHQRTKNRPPEFRREDIRVNHNNSSSTTDASKQQSLAKSPFLIGSLVLIILLLSIYFVSKRR